MREGRRKGRKEGGKEGRREGGKERALEGDEVLEKGWRLVTMMAREIKV